MQVDLRVVSAVARLGGLPVVEVRLDLGKLPQGVHEVGDELALRRVRHRHDGLVHPSLYSKYRHPSEVSGKAQFLLRTK